MNYFESGIALILFGLMMTFFKKYISKLIIFEAIISGTIHEKSEKDLKRIEKQKVWETTSLILGIIFLVFGVIFLII